MLPAHLWGGSAEGVQLFPVFWECVYCYTWVRWFCWPGLLTGFWSSSVSGPASPNIFTTWVFVCFSANLRTWGSYVCACVCVVNNWRLIMIIQEYCPSDKQIQRQYHSGPSSLVDLFGCWTSLSCQSPSGRPGQQLQSAMMTSQARSLTWQLY